MQLMLITTILSLGLWSTSAIPTVPQWIGDDDIEDLINGLESTTVDTISFAPNVPTPPLEGCLTEDGSVAVGTAYTIEECKHCKCISAGHSECFTINCPRIECVDYVYIKGKCCPICLNGANCRLPDGTILEKGKKLELVDMSCECSEMDDSWEEPVAACLVKN